MEKNNTEIQIIKKKNLFFFVQEPTEEQKACHTPKPILLDTGEVSTVIKSLVVNSR